MLVIAFRDITLIVMIYSFISADKGSANNKTLSRRRNDANAKNNVNLIIINFINNNVSLDSSRVQINTHTQVLV